MSDKISNNFLFIAEIVFGTEQMLQVHRNKLYQVQWSHDNVFH